jgi:hypothetical protein
MWKTDLHEELPAKSFVRRKQGRYSSFCRIALCALTHTRRSIVRYTPLLATIVVAATTGTGTAQIPLDSLVAGDFVRYELARTPGGVPQEASGTLNAVTPVAVMLSEVDDYQNAEPLLLPREYFARMDVARGTRDIRWPGTVIGAAGGCAVGIVTSGDVDALDKVLRCTVGVALGGLLGYGGGLLIKGPRWIEVLLD